MRVSPPIKRWMINGAVIAIPLLVTLMIVVVIVDFAITVLTPFTDAIAVLWADEPTDALLQAITVAAMFGIVLLIGVVAEYTPGAYISRSVDRLMASVPVVSTVYTGLQRASEVLVDDASEQFRDVKLVEFPTEGSYMVGFVTGDPPPELTEAANATEMETVMVPLAPNPATNGVVLHLSTARTREIDLTVEEAIQSIMTLGMTVTDDE